MLKQVFIPLASYNQDRRGTHREVRQPATPATPTTPATLATLPLLPCNGFTGNMPPNYISGQGDFASTADHKDPPRAAPPPSPLRMVMDFFSG